MSIAVGVALAAKLDGQKHKVFCLMGDGEQQEGQVWEAAMEAGHFHLDNLIGIIDCNRLQIDGWVKDVMDVEPLAAKYGSFGWDVLRIDGHDMKQVVDALEQAKAVTGRPAVILADTVKGKGVSFMQDIAGWHGKAPNREELTKALTGARVSPIASRSSNCWTRRTSTRWKSSASSKRRCRSSRAITGGMPAST